MNNLRHLSFLKSALHFHLCNRSLHSAKYVLDIENRQIYEDIFPDINVNDVKKLWNKPPQCVYSGFDPTAESLHIGNLLILINLIHWQRSGHRVIVLLGGATGMIGDPSYRKSERVEINQIVLKQNLDSIQKDIQNIFDNHGTYFCRNKKNMIPVTILNNLDWYKDINIISFVKEIGKYFRMGTMLGRTSVQSRLQSESGMSFTEFSYQLFQAYDWLHLQRTYNCNFQIGGQDQMGNIVSGYDLISKYINKTVYGLTLPLVTAEGGKKFGKSTGNVIWLSPSKSSSFQLYQYFVRLPDSDVEKFLQFFTFLHPQKIKVIVEEHFKKPEHRTAQKILAENVTLLVHGNKGLEQAKRTSAILYEQSVQTLSKINANELSQLLEGATIVDVFTEIGLTVYELAMKAKCFQTNSDARRIITAGGFYINYQKITNTEEVIVPGIHILSNNVSLLRTGKKSYHIVRWI